MRFLFIVLGMVLAGQAIGFDINQLMGQQQTTQRPKPGEEELSPGPYPTKKALLDAVSSGEFRQYIEKLDHHRRKTLLASVLTILQADYGLPSVRQYADIPRYSGQVFSWKNQCLSAAGEHPDAMYYFFQFRIHESSNGRPPLPNFQTIQERMNAACTSDRSGFGKQFLSSLTMFMQNYSDAIDTYMASLEEQRREREVADAEARKTAAKAAAEEKARREIDEARKASLRAAEETRRQAEAEATAAAQEARADQLQKCLDSSAYKVVQAAWEIEQGEEMIRQGRAAIEHDDQVAKVSGATDLRLRRQAGEFVVAGKALVDKSFANYRKYGGTVAVPSKVRGGSDPCEKYR